RDVERRFGLGRRMLQRRRSIGEGPPYAMHHGVVIYERERLEAWRAAAL
ncbi:MAG: hypothetical protein JWM33_664, partial [Caulobacteraceae bacterium]|nr:hypothetical protein [Caulobacteraceae bacterium]